MWIRRRRWPRSRSFSTSIPKLSHSGSRRQSTCSRSSRRASPSTAIFLTFWDSSPIGMPGTDSPDYAAMQILSDVLASQRADLYGMVPAGKALAAEFGVAESYRKASVGYGVVALPAGVDADAAPSPRCARSITKLCTDGVPEDLVDASKQQRNCASRVSAQLHSRSRRRVVWRAGC